LIASSCAPSNRQSDHDVAAQSGRLHEVRETGGGPPCALPGGEGAVLYEEVAAALRRQSETVQVAEAHVVEPGVFAFQDEGSRLAPIGLTAVAEAVRSDRGLVVPHGIRFSESSIPGDVAAVGAATLVLDDSFSPRPEALRIGTTGEAGARFSTP
jgi:hypothetical protein